MNKKVIANLAQNGSKKMAVEGNTIPTAPAKRAYKKKDSNQVKEKRVNPGKSWCFTWNNYKKEDIDKLISVFANTGSNSYTYIFGKEIGENSLIPHLQGFVVCEKKIRPKEHFKLDKEIHWEPMKGSIESNMTYCTKEGEYYTSKHLVVPIELLSRHEREKKLDLIKQSDFFNWQNELVNILKNKPSKRSLYWIYSKEGKTGKTEFAKWLSFHMNAIPLNGKKNDILYCAAEFESNIYIYPLSRTMEDFVSYDSLESIKDGFYMCGKFESKPICRPNPHVIIFANFRPDKSKMSKDRWNIWNINRRILNSELNKFNKMKNLNIEHCDDGDSGDIENNTNNSDISEGEIMNDDLISIGNDQIILPEF